MLIWVLAALAQFALLLALWRGARNIIMQKIPDGAPRAGEPHFPANPPLVAMFVPVAGKRPEMASALRSLLRQDYTNVLPVMITETADDPAVEIITSLQKEFPAVRHVIAGQSSGRGQKNHNILQGIAAFGSEADIYLFCDSTHEARPDFIRQIIWPVASGETAIATGYHNVRARDAGTVSLAYLISVLIMRFLQAVSTFTQPWGGALAIRREIFERYNISGLWSDNVVDDCSLAGMLLSLPCRLQLHARLCTRAILDTFASGHRLEVWQTWMDRQILFLKFCVPGQWYLLGVFAFLMFMPSIVSVFALLAGICGLAKGLAPWFAFAHLAALSLMALCWREFQNEGRSPILPWLKAFWLAMLMFFMRYLKSVPAKGILWHGIYYVVGRGGKVLSMTRGNDK